MNKFWQIWLTNNNHFSKDEANFRRVIILNFSLSIMSVFLFAYALFNLLIAPDYLMAIMQFIALALTLLLILFFKLSHQVEISSWIGELIFILVVLAAIIIDKNEYLVFAWALLIPPVSYFILGRLYGTIMSALFAGGFAVIFVLYPPAVSINHLDVFSFINVFGTFLSLALIINYYEANRAANLHELNQKNSDLKRLAETDKLTSLYNRLKLDASIEAEIEIAENTKNPFSLIMIDIDNFKRINDEYGHLVGDSVLTQAAYLLRKNLPEHVLIGRWGGEEFLIVCPNTDAKKAHRIAENLRHLINNYPFDGNINFTISLGVSAWKQGDTYDDLVKRADRAMYEAKSKGKNTVES